MNGIFTLLIILIMIACVLLIIIIMAQNPKGGGLSGTFGGASSAQFGVQRTNEFMDKATWTLGGLIVGLILLTTILTAPPVRSLSTSKKAPQRTSSSTSQVPAATQKPASAPASTPAPVPQRVPVPGRP